MQAVYRILVGPQVGANFGIYAPVNSTDWFDAMILNNPFRRVRAVVLPTPFYRGSDAIVPAPPLSRVEAAIAAALQLEVS